MQIRMETELSTKLQTIGKVRIEGGNTGGRQNSGVEPGAGDSPGKMCQDGDIETEHSSEAHGRSQIRINGLI